MSANVEPLAAALSDRYRLERELGAGGMATVWLAEDLKHQRQVAVKVLREDLTASLGKERFLREITIAAGLTHPHILPLHDSGEAAGRLFYVMPYVDGPSLRQKLLRGGELPVADAVRILRDVADAMAHAHKRGVVHRDLKPENVMLTERHALVTDFGVAKAVSAATGRQTLTTAGVALGTPAYMSPEQATADPNADHRSDIYAFGVLAYELLTGRPPFSGGSPQEVLAAQVTTAAVPVTQHRASIPPALAALVMRCLEKKPADRPQGAEELIPQLEALLTPSGGITPHETAPHAMRRSAPSRTRMILAGVAVLVLAIGGYAAWRARNADGGSGLVPNLVAVMPLANQTGDTALQRFGSMIAGDVARALDRLEGVQVVPTDAIVAELAAVDSTASRPVDARRLAEVFKAGVALNGVIHAVGDSLRVEMSLIDVARGTVLSSLEPLTVAAAERMSVLDVTSRRSAAAVAQRLNITGSPWAQWVATPPPSYEAYSQLLESAEHYSAREHSDALEHVDRALALDPEWRDALGQRMIVLFNLRRHAEAESLAARLERRPEGLPEMSRLNIAWMRAQIAGDAQQAYRIHLRYPEKYRNDMWRFLKGQQALSLNRPRETIEEYRQINPDRGEMRGRWSYWENLANAHHMRGEHDRELNVAQAGRAAYPDKVTSFRSEVQARSALGQREEVLGLLRDSRGLAPQEVFGDSIEPWVIATVAANELRAHGDSAGATEAARFKVEWLRSLPDRDSTSVRAEIAYTLYQAQDWSGAKRAYEALVAEFPKNTTYQLRNALSAAHLGDRTLAQRLAQRISSGEAALGRDAGLLWQVRIAAVLGDREGAMRFLRERFSRGSGFGVGLHRDPDFASLRGIPEFDAWISPKG